MSLSPKQKKWSKRLLIFVAVCIALAGLLYYVIVYRVKDVLKYTIGKETNGTYKFDAKDIRVSLFDKNVRIKKVSLLCVDTANTSPHYDVAVSDVYFAVDSWKELIMHQQLSVDSLSIDLPEIKIHDHNSIKKPAKPISFHAASVMDGLQKILVKLKVRSFHLNNGGFQYARRNGPAPLISENINFFIKDFSKKNPSDSSLLSAGDIDIYLDRQHWVLPDGNHEISFSKLHFSGQKQIFELDSFALHVAPQEGKGEVSVSADKLFFNSKQLAAIYTKEELLIDTLICVRPVLKLPVPPKKDKPEHDTATATSALNSLFKNINFKYIKIQDGSFVMDNKNHISSTYSTQTANVEIFNFSLVPERARKIKTDSIHLNIKNIGFYSKDSSFLMTVDELSFNNRDLLFTNAKYAPTSLNHSGKGLSFTTPALRLKNISLEDLFAKRLKADEAELITPIITIDAKKGKPGNRPANAHDSTSSGQLFLTLHTLHDLISVRDFHIVEGTVNFKAVGVAPVAMGMTGVNVHILLDRFLRSDSLVDIKRALPMLSVRDVSLRSHALNMLIKNYSFDGSRRQNNAETFKITLNNGTVLNGKKLHWFLFDWDMFQNHKIILVDAVSIGELDAIAGNQPAGEKKHAAKQLPVIHIGRLDIDKVRFTKDAPGNSLHFNAENICTDNINTQNQFFTWGNARGLLFDIGLDNKGTVASVNRVRLNNENTTTIEGTSLAITKETGSTHVEVPEIKLKADLHSTDFSQLHIYSLVTENPAIAITKKGAAPKTTGHKPINIPLNLLADKLDINNANISYNAETAKDTILLTGKLGLDANGIRTSKTADKILTYEKAELKLHDTKMNKGHLAVSVPQVSVALTNGHAQKVEGNRLAFFSSILLQFANASMVSKKTDTTELALEKVSGSFNDPAFHLQPHTKLALPSLISKVTVSDGSLYLKEKAITAKAGSYNWDPVKNQLTIRGFDMLPNLSMEESFKKWQWQKDYLTVKGESVTISGIDVEKYTKDSAIVIKKVVLEKAVLSTSKDKRMPFQHGIEKPMFTQLIKSMPLHIQVDSLLVQQSAVTVNITSPRTNKWGSVPLENINAAITNFKTRHNENDSLTLVANLKLFNSHIRRFSYKESYGDSLSGFVASSNISTMKLPEFNKLAIPLGAVSVDMGNVDTLYSTWKGNKYAAFGKMNFNYNDLKIRVLDKEDSTKKKLLLSLESWLGNLLLRDSNKKERNMFVVRDPEKAPFVYWVKAKMSGFLTSVGVKRNKKYVKQYKKVQQQYHLPDL